MTDYRNMVEMADIGRTPALCHDALTELMEELFDGMLFASPAGERAVKVYQQDLPIPTDNDVDADTDNAPPPFIIVLLDAGEVKDDDNPQTIDFNLILCGYDAGKKRTGWRDVANMRERIIQRFCTRPYFGGAFTVLKPFQWAFQQDDSYPYFYGVITVTCTAPAMTQDSLVEELL